MKIWSFTVCAEDADVIIEADMYEFDEKSAYEISSSDIALDAKAYGQFSVSGDIASSTKENNIPSYAVENGNLSVSYTYSYEMLTAEEGWQLVEDKNKSIDGIALDEKIQKGALIFQTSKDGKIWINVFCDTNIFEDIPSQKDAFYTTTDVQLANGCYYRAIVAYEVRKLVEPTEVLFVEVDNYEYKKYAEVYTFYAYDKEAFSTLEPDSTNKYKLGTKVRTEKFEGYYGEAVIDEEDPHYGWDIGQFFVDGYTDYIKDSDENPVFLKDVGDKVTLWFNLQQDINCLNGNSAITIAEDLAGTDQYFETVPTDFGHGALIVRKTNYENVQEEPIIYKNYLEASATVGANTKVDLFEEGDYEVALDYEIKHDKTQIFGTSILPKSGHYRIYFKFSIRNANCMVYPFDIATKSELSNSSITPNGFYLDRAKSRYLKVYIKREILKDGADGLTEDVRFNSAAKDGEQYTEEGIYTITVTNQYTNQTTTKKIYVGTNNLLKAHVVTGLSISEIQDKIALGAVITEDGSIIEAETTIDENNVIEEIKITQEEKEKVTEESQNEDETITADMEENSISDMQKNQYHVDNRWLLIAILMIVVIGIGVIVVIRRKSEKKVDKEMGEDKK